MKWRVLLAGCALLTTAEAVVVQDYGAVRIHYYEEGDPQLSGYTARRSFTAPEMEASGRAAQYIDAVITDVPYRSVNVHFMWADGLGPTTLGGSSSEFYGLSDGVNLFAGTAMQTVWAFGLNAGSVESKDCTIIYNPDFNWYTGTASTGFSGVDLQSVVTHEITHGLGFLSSFDVGTGLFGFNNTYLTIWDYFLSDAAGNVPEAGSTGTPGDFNETGNPVYWTGENGIAAYRAQAGVAADALVPVFAPDPYQSGSSLSHVDEVGWDGLVGTADDLPAIMNWAIAEGVAKREFHPVELGMMRDMEWSVIPEPMTALLLIPGLGGLLALRRRRKGLLGRLAAALDDEFSGRSPKRAVRPQARLERWLERFEPLVVWLEAGWRAAPAPAGIAARAFAVMERLERTAGRLGVWVSATADRIADRFWSLLIR